MKVQVNKQLMTYSTSKKAGAIVAVVLMALMGLMGCSSDDSQEVVPQPTETGQAIVFSADEQEEAKVTRAVGLAEKGVTVFKVWSFKHTDENYSAMQTVINGYYVRWTSNSAATSVTNSDGWEYVNQQPFGDEEQTIKYWDYSASAYRFFAVAGATGTNEVTGNLNTADNTFTLEFKADATDEATIPYYSHLWFSTGNLAEYPDKQFGKPVQMEFVKPLSKVRFMFIFEDPKMAEETTLTDKSFHPSNGNTIKIKGDVTITYPLTGTAVYETFADANASGVTELTQDYYESVRTETYTINEQSVDVVISPYLNADATVLNKIYTVLPTPSGQSSYTMTVSVNGEPKSTVVPATFMTWLPGYQYTYIFKVHVDGSVTIDNVQSAFTKWEIKTDELTIYNW